MFTYLLMVETLMKTVSGQSLNVQRPYLTFLLVMNYSRDWPKEMAQFIFI